MTVDINHRRYAARQFTEALKARVKRNAPGVRLQLTLWNRDGVVTGDEIQRFTVSSKLCKERAFDIVGADLDGAFASTNPYDEHPVKHDRAARQRVDALLSRIFLAVIGREADATP